MKKIIISERQEKLLSSLNNKRTFKITQEQHKMVQRILKEDIGSSELHQAVATLIHDIYNTPSQAGLGDFWVRNGITWADINTYLTSLGLIIATGKGTYELARKVRNRFFKPNEATLAAKGVEDALGVLVKKKGNYLKDSGQQIMTGDKRLEMEDINDVWPNNPYDERDAEIPKVTGPRLYKAVALNSEIAILKDGTDTSYVFYYDELPEGSFGDVARIELSDIANYVNNNIKNISVGEGLAGFQGDKQLIKVDEALRAELISLYDKSPSIVQSISQLSEVTTAGSSATGGSSGPFVGPMNSPIIKKTPVVAEGLLREFNIMQAHKLNTKYNKDYDGRFNVNEGPVASGSIISKSALLETIINELGLGDWKVKIILDKVSEIEDNEVQYASIFKLITGNNMDSNKYPKESLILALKEMSKEDVDYLYNQMFPAGI